MKRLFLTAYQLLMSLCIISIWVLLAFQGIIPKWDAPQWSIMILLTIAAIGAVVGVQMAKNDAKKAISER